MSNSSFALLLGYALEILVGSFKTTKDMAPLGLVSKSEGSNVPLKSVQIRSKVHGYTSEVVAMLEYENNSNTPIEAIYIFPIDEDAAVCGFQATIDGRTITAEVQEKQEARDTYDDAISSGHSTAYLLESGENYDVFQISVGNLPPYSVATIEITFVAGLVIEREGKIVFLLPLALNPRYNPAMDSKYNVSTTMPTVASVSTKYTYDFELDVQCASAIQEITSPSNQLKVYINPEDDRQAKVRLNEEYKLNVDLQVLILSSQPFEPHALVENGVITKTKDDKEFDDFMSKPVVMLNFFPEFDSSSSLERGEFLFIIDRSGSMSGAKMRSARETLLLFLKSLPNSCYFNVIGFGTSFQKLFQKSEVYSDSTVDVASSHAQYMQADLGGTEILRPLNDVFSQPLIKGYPRQVFLLTDGEVGNTQQVIDLVTRNAVNTRCFTFGIGEGASTALVKGVARAGRGIAEFVYSGDRLQPKVIKTLKIALQPAMKDVRITWTLPKSWEVQTIPTTSPTIFAGNSLVAFGILNRKDQNNNNKRQIVAIEGTATLTGYTDGHRSSVVQHTIKFSAVRGNPGDRSMMLHRLCAKATIQEKQNQFEGDIKCMSNDIKIPIIQLSKSANIISKLTSFVAFDQKSHEPISRAMEIPLMTKIHHDGGGRVFALCSMNRGGPPTKPTPPVPQRESSKVIGRKTLEERGFKLQYGKPSTPSDIISNIHNPLSLISLQTACGSWLPTSQLASIFRITLDNLLEACPKELSDKESVWATALALSFLFLKFEDTRDEWEIVAAKGIKWIKSKLSSDNLSYIWIMEIASEFLKI